MADNFNLRQFLTENKLTKNTQLLKEEVSLNGKPVDVGSIEIEDIDTADYPDFTDAYITYAEFEDGTPLTEEELVKFEEENYGIVGELIFDRQLYLEGDGEEGGEADHGHGIEQAQHNIERQYEETVKESTMTQRDKYLTRLVENALGLQVTEDDNVDYTMGRQDDPNQLPNPAPELTIPEGEDMVEEKPLPKYENIEKLMQEIDKNTDEEAHKFKVQEMKRVADMLEKKCTALEEGDDADHIDQKKLKQMKKDIMTLRKGIEKMEKLGEKKFTKKETKAELKEGFDLRKFLVENKLTANSKMLNEGVITPIDYEKLKQILLLACNTFPEDDEDGSALYEKSDVKHTIKYVMTLEKGVKNDDFDVFDKLEGQEPATFEGIVNLDDVQSTKWDDIDLALSGVSSVAYEYDLDDTASALDDLAKAIDSFQL